MCCLLRVSLFVWKALRVCFSQVLCIGLEGANRQPCCYPPLVGDTVTYSSRMSHVEGEEHEMSHAEGEEQEVKKGGKEKKKNMTGNRRSSNALKMQGPRWRNVDSMFCFQQFWPVTLVKIESQWKNK